jgi:DNA polymerase V
MKQKVVALVDCDNFYISCERVFRAAIRNKPVIVLSNNDGCVIARSNEAKRLNIRMGQPLFQIEKLIRKHNIEVFSSNFSLYADLSSRVMRVLRQFTPHVEIFSIDEAFLDLTDLPMADLTAYGRELRARVLKLTGIPVSVGIARTKTLCKIACELVKERPEYYGVCDLTSWSDEELDSILANVSVDAVWGIGERYAAVLRSRGIETAKALKEADERWIRKRLTVVGERTVLELRGIACNPVETKTRPKKGIMCSKSFGQTVTTLEHLSEAVATYTARAAEKLRSQGSLAGTITVFIRTNYGQSMLPQYSNDIVMTLPTATSFTPELIEQALRGLKAIYKPGYQYQKAGVYLSNIVPDSVVQPDLFADFSLLLYYRKLYLMTVIDAINRKWGKDTIFFASQGIERVWKMRQRKLSPRYTTHWTELLSVN